MGTEPERPPTAADPAPAAFHYGAGHMIMHGNAVFVAMFGHGVVGQPAREAMIGLPAKPFELMDLVYTPGKPGASRVTTNEGEQRLVVAPRRYPQTGEINGVTTHLRPIPA
jgi:hypothetical protein